MLSLVLTKKESGLGIIAAFLWQRQGNQKGVQSRSSSAGLGYVSSSLQRGSWKYGSVVKEHLLVLPESDLDTRVHMHTEVQTHTHNLKCFKYIIYI